MAILIPRGNVNGDLYAQAITSAHLPGLRVYDPDFALAQDPDIYNKIERDAVVKHAIEMRQHLVAGRRGLVETAGDSDEDKLAAEIIETLMDQIQNMPETLFNLSKAFLKGSTYSFIKGARRDFNMPSVDGEWWHPVSLKDIDRRRFRKQIDPELSITGEIQAFWEFHELKSGQFFKIKHPELFVKHIYENTEERLGYGRGLLESLYYYHYAKTLVLTEGLGAVERWAQGFLHVGIDGARTGDGTPNTVVIDAWKKHLKEHKARDVFVHDKEDIINLQDGPGTGWQIVMQMLAYLDKAITTLILGANLPSSSEGNSGSYALGKVQEDSREALINYDRVILGETITRDVIGLIWRLNRGNFDRLGIKKHNLPKWRISQDKKDDNETTAKIIQTLLQSNVPLRKDEVYANTGFTVPQEGDEVIEPVQPQQPPAGGGLPGLGL